jgi:hypothetical protein
LDNSLQGRQAVRRYAVGANVAWIAWPEEIAALDEALQALNLSGLVILGSSERARIGLETKSTFYQRVKKALDPARRWVEV